jgi:hypothetical protein
MAKTLQHRRGTTAELSSITGAAGEIFYDTTKDTLVVMDGSLAGGYPLEKEGAGTGATGPAGATGAAGVNGASGFVGSNGATGATGTAGASGVAGATGIFGGTLNDLTDVYIGASGAADGQFLTYDLTLSGWRNQTVALGATGATGAAGASGVAGSNGTNGTNGATGPQGASGPQGLQGASGSAGTNGSTGAMGASGSQGPTGASGPQSGYLNGPISGFVLLVGATGAINNGATGNGWFGGSLYVGPQGATGVAWGATGEIRATNEITAYYSSDERLKENITTIDNALGKLRKLKGVMFDWKDDVVAGKGGEDGYFVRKHDTGVIAQEVEEVLPEVVAERQDGFKAVRYEKLAGLIIQAINELADQVDALKK